MFTKPEWVCQRVDCEEKAEVFAVIYAKPKDYDEQSVLVIVPRPICGFCSLTMRLDNLLRRVEMEKMSEMVARRFGAELDLEGTRIEWKKLEEFGRIVPEGLPMTLPKPDWLDKKPAPAPETKEES
jgi:hypothetical protein